MPPTTSVCPDRYLVVEWMTMSAPCSIGRQSMGVAKVLSTTETRPSSRATANIPGRSATWHIGLAMVSR